MSGSELDVSTLLRTAYRAPAPDGSFADRVRARVALIDTIGEVTRLLVEAPVFAFTASVGGPSAPAAETVEGGSDGPGD